MTMSSCNSGMMNGQFGDTTLTKVFVGGLAWETPKETMRDHFAKYGEILEAVIIFDKVTGRSKGYGFVTFKEPESAKKACGDPTPMINGRRANCNLAVIGARRPRQSFTPPSPQPFGSNGGAKPTTSPPPPPLSPQSHVEWYYRPGAPHASPYHHNHIPYYGYTPTYVAVNASYNPKVSYGGGVYMNGHYGQMYSGGGQPAAAAAMNVNMNMMGAAANTLMPIYPVYHYQHHHHHHHQSQAMALPAHMFPPAISTPIISKPTPVSVPPTTAVGGIVGGAAAAAGGGVGGESLKKGS